MIGKIITNYILPIVAIGIAIWALVEAKRANKTTIHQNTQSEINRIENDIYQLEKEIERLEKPNQHVYGIYTDVSTTNKICNLKDRKQKLENQLKQLKAKL